MGLLVQLTSGKKNMTALTDTQLHRDNATLNYDLKKYNWPESGPYVWEE